MKNVTLIIGFAAVTTLAGCGGPASDWAGYEDGFYADSSYLLEADPRTGEQIFNEDVKPNIEKSCVRCHGNPAPDYATAKTKIVPKKPDESLLYTKATGVKHLRVWKPESDQALKLRHWIESEE